MGKEEKFYRAGMAQLDQICYIYSACKEQLLAKGIKQWGDWENQYPGEDFIRKAIIKEELYLLVAADQSIIASVVLNEEQAEIWGDIPWSEGSEPCLVIHGLIVNPLFQGKGYGHRVVEFCESLGREKGFAALRLDAFEKNEFSWRLYEKHGFQKRGSVLFKGKPENNQRYFCYEKLILSP